MSLDWIRDLDAFCVDIEDVTIDAGMYLIEKKELSKLDDLRSAREVLRMHLPEDEDLGFLDKFVEDQRATVEEIRSRMKACRDVVVHDRSILIRIMDKVSKALAHADNLVALDKQFTDMVSTPAIPPEPMCHPTGKEDMVMVKPEKEEEPPSPVRMGLRKPPSPEKQDVMAYEGHAWCNWSTDAQAH